MIATEYKSKHDGAEI